MEKIVKIDACEQTTSEKAIVVQTPFSHLIFKKLTPKTSRFFAPLLISTWPKSSLQFDPKNCENMWTDL